MYKIYSHSTLLWLSVAVCQVCGIYSDLYVQPVGVVAQRVQQRGGQRQQLARQQRVGAVAHRIAFVTTHLTLLNTMDFLLYIYKKSYFYRVLMSLAYLLCICFGYRFFGWIRFGYISNACGPHFHVSEWRIAQVCQTIVSFGSKC